MSTINRFVKFEKRPTGAPTSEIFSVQNKELPAIKAGQYLMRNAYLSMDPALVGRMRDEDNYAEKVNPGEVMHAYGVSQVIESKHPDVKVGEVRLGRVDMQQFTISNDNDAFKKVNLGLAKATHFLGAVGITGATAYFAMRDIGQPKPGETVLISAGGSSVGTVAAQIAKLNNCRTVAIVSTDEKAIQVKQDWEYDAAISYRGKSIEQLSQDIKQACPKGVDVYFDNTSGDISEAVMDNYSLGARVAVVGRLAISNLTDTRLDKGRRDNNIMLTRRVKRQGFVILDYQKKLRGSLIQLALWVKQGKIKSKEDIKIGIDSAPDAFFRMLEGKNNGKQLVKLADIDDKLIPDPNWVGRMLISKWFPSNFLIRKLS
ncbi:MAG: NADP-dependent oxidoreductase [Bermanella sp.]